MIERTVLRLMIGAGLPIAAALVMEQLPKTRIAEVPFAFQIQDQKLPPGTYSVKQAGLGRSILIQNKKLAGAGMKCVAFKRKFGKAELARLVFDSYQGRYLLSEVWFDADGPGVVLRRKDSGQKGGSQGRGGEIKCVSLQ
jgi:hypothetical protein